VGRDCKWLPVSTRRPEGGHPAAVATVPNMYGRGFCCQCHCSDPAPRIVQDSIVRAVGAFRPVCPQNGAHKRMMMRGAPAASADSSRLQSQQPPNDLPGRLQNRLGR
jgi:hypothetical protein